MELLRYKVKQVYMKEGYTPDSVDLAILKGLQSDTPDKAFKQLLSKAFFYRLGAMYLIIMEMKLMPRMCM